MNRALVLQAGIGTLLMGGGAALLLRRGALRSPALTPSGYALRIAGMMMFAAGLMATGFALALTIAVAP